MAESPELFGFLVHCQKEQRVMQFAAIGANMGVAWLFPVEMRTNVHPR